MCLQKDFHCLPNAAAEQDKDPGPVPLIHTGNQNSILMPTFSEQDFTGSSEGVSLSLNSVSEQKKQRVQSLPERGNLVLVYMKLLPASLIWARNPWHEKRTFTWCISSIQPNRVLAKDIINFNFFFQIVFSYWHQA